MIFDTHAHYDDIKFDEDRDELIKSLFDNNIGYVVNVGSSLKSSYQTVDLTKKYEKIYGAVGVHPEAADELNEDNIQEVIALSKNEKILAIGEIGLDYYYDDVPADIQKKWFVRQLDIGRKEKLPVIIHSRDAAADTLDIMKAEKAGEIGGVVHCYSYSVEIAREYLEMGMYFGIGGVLTFNNAKKLKEVVEYLPMESIVLETDCPYLAPVPYRGKRNSSLYLSYVVEKISELKGIAKEEVERITFENARKLYRF